MKLSVNMIFQLIALGIQTANSISPFLPGKGQAYIAAGIAVGQGIGGILAHFYNPNGTPAALPYSPQ